MSDLQDDVDSLPVKDIRMKKLTRGMRGVMPLESVMISRTTQQYNVPPIRLSKRCNIYNNLLVKRKLVVGTTDSPGRVLVRGDLSSDTIHSRMITIDGHMLDTDDGELTWRGLEVYSGQPTNFFNVSGSLITSVNGKLYFNGREVLLGDTILPNMKLVSMRPFIGMNYQPSPSNYNSLPPPPVYFDSDFWNADFPALWGDTANTQGVVGRDDISKIRTAGCNLIKGYNYDPLRNHSSFLEYCDDHDLKVFIPISNFFIDGGGTPEETAPIIQDAITYPSVIGITIGNELIGMQNAQAIAQIFSMIVALDTQNKLVCTSPLQVFDPTGLTFPEMATTIQTAIASIGLLSQYNSKWFHSANVYPPIPIDVFLATWQTSIHGDLPLMFTEYGRWSSEGEMLQADSITQQNSGIFGLSGRKYATFLGACLFEWSDELWKPATSENTAEQEQSFGITTFEVEAGEFMYQTDTTLQGMPYLVNDMVRKVGYDAYVSSIPT